jgi:hypothetical protein
MSTIPKITILINSHGEETYESLLINDNTELRTINAVPVGCFSCIPMDISPDIIEKELNLMNISKKQFNIKRNLENYLPLLNKKFNNELCEYKKDIEKLKSLNKDKYDKISTMTTQIINNNCFNITIPKYNRIYKFNSNMNVIEGDDDIKIIHYNNNPLIDDIFNKYITFNSKNKIYSFHLIENQNELYNKYISEDFSINYNKKYKRPPTDVFDFNSKKNKILENMTNIFKFKEEITKINYKNKLQK